MIHDIDILLSYVNSDIKNIQASGSSIISNEIDLANARIEFINGCVANLTASRVSENKMRKFRIFRIKFKTIFGTAIYFFQLRKNIAKYRDISRYRKPFHDIAATLLQTFSYRKKLTNNEYLN